MHFYFFIRAIIHDEEMFIKNLQSMYLNHRFKDPQTGEIVEKGAVQLAVRRTILGIYEIVFPEPEYDFVMKSMGRMDTLPGKKFEWLLKIIRLCLGAKPMVEPKKEVMGLMNCRANKPDIRVYPIGIRPNVYKDGFEQL